MPRCHHVLKGIPRGIAVFVPARKRSTRSAAIPTFSGRVRQVFLPHEGLRVALGEVRQGGVYVLVS